MDLECWLAETPGTLPSFPSLARYLFFTATADLAHHRHSGRAETGREGKAQSCDSKLRPETAPTGSPVLIGETAAWRIYLHYRPDEAWLRSPASAFTHTGRGHSRRQRGHRQAGARVRRGEIHQSPLASGIARGLRPTAAFIASKLNERGLNIRRGQLSESQTTSRRSSRNAMQRRDSPHLHGKIRWSRPSWTGAARRGTRSRLPACCLKAKDASGSPFVPPWLHREDGIGRPVPNICLKLPTGGGKTYLATRCVEQLQRLYYRRANGLFLWDGPSDAIYSQTWKNLANREHAYRTTLERASGGRVKLLRRGDSFTKTDVETYLCVFVMMMAAAARQDTDVLKMFQDTGRYPGFFPAEDDFEAQKELLKLVPNLGTLDLAEGAWVGGPTVKQSLGNALCLARPTVILDEGHTAYTPTRRATLAKFNPSFILELSATPNRAREQQSNVLHSVSGMALKRSTW